MKKNKLKFHKEKSTILETKVDKIIFAVSVFLYAVVMLIEFKLTPMHSTISSSIAALGVSAFLISKAIHVKKVRPPILTKDKIKFCTMIIISAFLIISVAYWILKEYIF